MNTVFYNNTLLNWAYGIGAMVLAFVIMRILKGIIHHRILAVSKKTGTDIDDLIADMIRRIHFIVLAVLSVYIGVYFLKIPDKVLDIVQKLVILALLLQAAIWGNGLISYWVERYKKKRMAEDAASVTTFTALGFILRIVLWSFLLLLALENLGINVTALVAGLGVGGIAIALALQNILSDLFASLSIVLDKPFVIGDFIIVDNYLGSVEHIGLKTTRLRSLSGEQLVIANSDLLKSRIRNYKRMYERRVVFSLGVIYETSLEKLKSIPEMIKKIIESQKQVRFDRAHFKEYGNFSLNFEIVYWVKNPDFNIYMDIQQTINLEIYKQFAAGGIEFAYPTQVVYLTGENDTKSSSQE